MTKGVVLRQLAFGLQGERIGRGGGFYDRMIERVPKALTIGFAYDFQVRDTLPQKNWDLPVDVLVTDSRLIICDSV